MSTEITPDLAVTPKEGMGPVRPVETTPSLAPGSRRRTSTVDVHWLEAPGLPGPRAVDARARDVIGKRGDALVLSALSLTMRLDRTAMIEEVEAHGIEGDVGALVGLRVGPGFRRKAAEALPAERSNRSAAWTMIDDLATAMLVSNYARLRAGFQPPWVVSGEPPKADICSGWKMDGTFIQESVTLGRQLVTVGPIAPVLELPEEPYGWHAIAQLPINGVRRRRRLDVSPGDPLLVDAMFRDTYALDSSTEQVIHEYALSAEIDPVTFDVLGAQADPRVLPYLECPAAAASAERLGGLAIGGLREKVRAEFVGTSTCTHLNDLFRCLEDVLGLWGDGHPG